MSTVPRAATAPALSTVTGVCPCGNEFLDDSIFCRKCGRPRNEANGFCALEDLPPIAVAEDQIAKFSLPQEALDFEPDALALASTFTGGDVERKIHCNIELRPDELELIKTLQEEARKQGRSYYTSITVMASRYISYARGNAPKALSMMDETQRWRTEYFGKGPLDAAQLIEDFSHGVIYFTGRDFSMRPILVIRAERLPASWHSDGSGVTRLIRMLVFCMEYLRRYMFVPGKIENIVVLIDLRNLGLSDVPLKALKSIYSVLSHHYIVRVFRFYIVNMSWMLSTLVSVVKPILTDRQRQKLNFLKNVDECKSFALPHHLEDDLGGSRPKDTKFFPFPLQPGPFQAGSKAGPRTDAVENCHRVFTAAGFRGCIWDSTKTREQNLSYEYTDQAEDIFKACGLTVPANCPVKAPPETPAEATPAEVFSPLSLNGTKKFVVCLDGPFPWDAKETPPAPDSTTEQPASDKGATSEKPSDAGVSGSAEQARKDSVTGSQCPTSSTFANAGSETLPPAADRKKQQSCCSLM